MRFIRKEQSKDWLWTKQASQKRNSFRWNRAPSSEISFGEYRTRLHFWKANQIFSSKIKNQVRNMDFKEQTTSFQEPEKYIASYQQRYFDSSFDYIWIKNSRYIWKKTKFMHGVVAVIVVHNRCVMGLTTPFEFLISN